MHKIKEMFMNELYEYEDKAKKMNGGKLSQSDIERIHKLTDTVKNIDKIEMLEDGDGYSEDGHYMGEGRIYGTSYDDGMHREGGYSYARGRRYAKRDSMGRYSRDGGMSYDDDVSYARGGRGGNRGGDSRDDGKHYMMEQLEEMMEEAEKPAEKEALRRCMDALKRA